MEIIFQLTFNYNKCALQDVTLSLIRNAEEARCRPYVICIFCFILFHLKSDLKTCKEQKLSFSSEQSWWELPRVKMCHNGSVYETKSVVDSAFSGLHFSCLKSDHKYFLCVNFEN